jgi:hypothetical protein
LFWFVRLLKRQSLPSCCRLANWVCSATAGDCTAGESGTWQAVQVGIGKADGGKPQDWKSSMATDEPEITDGAQHQISDRQILGASVGGAVQTSDRDDVRNLEWVKNWLTKLAALVALNTAYACSQAHFQLSGTGCALISVGQGKLQSSCKFLPRPVPLALLCRLLRLPVACQMHTTN